MGPYILDMLVPVIFPYHEGTNVRNPCAANAQTCPNSRRGKPVFLCCLDPDVYCWLNSPFRWCLNVVSPACSVVKLVKLVKLQILMVTSWLTSLQTGPSNSTAPAAASAGAERVALPEPGFGTAPPRAERHPSCPAQRDGRRGGPLSILKLRPLLVLGSWCMVNNGE